MNKVTYNRYFYSVGRTGTGRENSTIQFLFIFKIQNPNLLTSFTII